MPLEHISLTAFQKHESLELDLSSPIITICGSSDSGKSSVLRALEFVLCNETPKGELATHGLDETKVELTVDGHTITRIKGKENLYYLDGEEYRAFGQNVPDKIAAILNVGTASVQKQHDSLFWLSDSAGQVSRSLNKIVNLDVIDDMLAHTAGELKKARTEAEITADRLKAARERRDGLAWVVNLELELRTVETAEQVLIAHRLERSGLAALVEQAKGHTQTKENAAAAALDALQVIETGDKANATGLRASNLRTLLTGIETAILQAERRPPDLGPLESAKSSLEGKTNRCQNLKNLLAELDRVKDDHESRQRAATRAAEELANLTAGEVCPVCSQPMLV